MKIILSRKGFDNENGEIASPIIPCGRLVSLPIPVNNNHQEEGEQGIPYADLRFDGQPLSMIIDQLSNGQFDMNQPAHLDPDLDRERYEDRGQGWRRTFGQQGRSQSHLRNRGVGEGDLFLFFGRFKQTKYENGGLKYVLGSEDLHVIFGWLQVGEILEVDRNQVLDEIPNWLHYHPHIVNRGIYINNTIYIAADHLTLDGISVRGAGTFPCFKSSLQLTAPGAPMGHWRLPKWFYPTPPKRPLSCHDDVERKWKENDKYAFLQSAPRGQEFVLDTQYYPYPGVIEWLRSLFENCC